MTKETCIMDESISFVRSDSFRTAVDRIFKPIPLLGYLFGFLICVLLEKAIGSQLAKLLGLSKMPILFGLVTIFKVVAAVVNLVIKDAAFNPSLLFQIPRAICYFGVVYLIPFVFIARSVAAFANALVKKLRNVSGLLTVIMQLGLLYMVCHVWAGVSNYRLIILKLTLIAVLLILSLNIINGYMGEFSCSHPGFMAIEAYIFSLFTVGLFSDDKVLGPALLNISWAYLTYPLALVAGGLAAAVGALIVAIPSFKTRGDYLAIISLAFLFIVNAN